MRNRIEETGDTPRINRRTRRRRVDGICPYSEGKLGSIKEDVEI